MPDKDLSTALDDLARGWIEQNPEEVVALREATKPFILADNLGESDRIVLEESIDEFRWLTGSPPAPTVGLGTTNWGSASLVCVSAVSPTN